MQSKIAVKILTVILSVSLMLQIGIPIVYAEDSNPTEETKPITKTVDSGNPKTEDTVETKAVKPQEGEAEEGGKTAAASLGNNSEENIDEQPQNQQEDADEISPEGEVNRNSLNELDEETKTKITAFGALSDTESKITIHVGADEETIKELFVFPQTIKATFGETETDLAVTWESDKTFSVEKEDTFIFTPELTDENYTLAEGIKMPTITVRVINNKAVTTLLLEDGVTDGGDITSTGLSLNESMPSKITKYKAGNGYVLFTPWSISQDKTATIELNNATIDSGDKNSIKLPSGNVNLIIKGNDELYSNLSNEESSCIFGNNTNLFVTGDGTLTATGKFSEIYGPPILSGYGIRLENNSKFIRDGQASFQLNLMAYTEYTDRKEQEVFGSCIQHDLSSDDANLIIFPNSQLTLQKPDGMGSDCEIFLRNKNLNICENGKLIIDDEVCLNIERNAQNALPAVYNKGSILVKGVLFFRDSSYLKDIAKMNITTQGRGAVVVDGHLIDTANGKPLFDNERGERLYSKNGGEWICGNGTMKWEPVVDEEGNLTSGTITLNNADITINSDRSGSSAIVIIAEKSVPITLNIVGNNTIENPYGVGILAGNLILTGNGIMNGKSMTVISYLTKFGTSNFNGKLNGIVRQVNGNTGTVYGTVSYSYNDRVGHACYDALTVSNGSTLTIEPGAFLNANTLTNNGTIINNGTLSLMRDVDDDKLQNWVYVNLNLKGNGMVEVRNPRFSAFALFTNDGKLINTNIDNPLDFGNATKDMGDIAKDGYHWDNQNKKLTIKNLIMLGNPSSDEFCAITLPEGEDVTLELKGYNKITGFKSAVSQGFVKIPRLTDKDIPSAKGSLTVYGQGTLMAEKQAYKKHENIITTTGKFILKSGNLLLKSEGKTGLASVGMDIKGGCIGQGKIFAPIKSIGSFNMSGGKVISGNGNDEGLVAFGDVTLSGGELITSRAWYSIMAINGNVKISGGKLIAHNSENESTAGISVFITGDEDKKVSINGGAVDIKTGMSALSFGTYPEAKGKGIFETNGMTVTTNPAGGKLKSTNIILPGPTAEQMTVYALTADESLKARGPELINACTSLNAVKNQTGGGSSDREHHSGGSLSSGSSNVNQISVNTPRNTVNETQAAAAVKAQIKKALESGYSSASVVIKNVTNVTPQVFQTLIGTAKANLGNNTMQLNANFDSTSADGRIQARMYVDMAEAANLKNQINTLIFTDKANKDNLRTEKIFEQYFNNNVRVITFGQQGNFGMKIGVAAKIDTTNLDRDNLKFYRYNPAKNTYSQIALNNYYFDRYGYLHFDTTLGDQIIVTDSNLIAR